MQEFSEAMIPVGNISIRTFETYIAFLGAAFGANLLTSAWLTIFRDLKTDIDSAAGTADENVGDKCTSRQCIYFFQTTLLRLYEHIVVTVSVLMAMGIYFSLLVVHPEHPIEKSELFLIWIAGFTVPALVGLMILFNALMEKAIRNSTT